MILSCPSCEANYEISIERLRETGREVKCAQCAHQWFQEPIEEPVKAEDIDVDSAMDDIAAAMEEDDGVIEEIDNFVREAEAQEEAEDAPEAEETASKPEQEKDAIPDAVKPLPEGEVATPVTIPKEVGFFAKAMGAGAALMLFAGILFAGVVFKQKITTFWPPIAMVYELAGFSVSYDGDGLIIENLSATILKDEESRDVLVVKGRVINMTEKPVPVPKMMAILRSTNGEDGEGWIIDAPVEEVKPNGSFAFTSDYPAVPAGVGSVNLTFIPAVQS